MRTSKIYQVKLDFNYTLLPFKGSKPHISYYSNLSKTVEALAASLVINGWGTEGLNYTAIYRSIKQKGNFVRQMRKQETPFFRIEIAELSLNPKLNTFDLEPFSD